MNDKKSMEFKEYFETYYNQVLSYIYKKIGREDVAEDMAMETFLSAYKNFDNYDCNKASFATWVYCIANNKLKNYYRDLKYDEDISNYNLFLDRFEDEIENAEYITNMRDVLYQAMQALTDSQRKIVVLKFYYDFDSNQIASEINTTPGNVRVQLSRALRKLNKYFDDNKINWEL